jgi:single-strand DNA-binding protein
MATLNKVMLIGRLTDNPEPPRTLPNSGSTVVRFRFAVGRSRKNPQTGQWENDPNPLYIDCEAFSRADNPRLTDIISQYCRKGSQIFVEGRLQLDTWEDKQTPGQKRSKHKVVVENVQFLDNRQDGGIGGGPGDEAAGAPRFGSAGFRGGYPGSGDFPSRSGPPPRQSAGFSPPPIDEPNDDPGSEPGGSDIPF